MWNGLRCLLKIMSLRLGCKAVRSLSAVRYASLCSPVALNTSKHLASNECYVLSSKLPDLNFHVRGFKSELKIKWVRPMKIPCIKPEKSGDLKPAPEVDLKQFPLGFERSQELKTADDNVRRIFSLKFMPRSKAVEVVREDFINCVKRHALDRSSMEARIATMTSGIRNLQALLDDQGKNKRMKVCLKELIDRRKKFLKYLRRWDYKRFEWLLEKLDLVYRPPPDHFHWITRKDSLRKLTDRYCENIKAERLASYRKSLESQQVAFLEEKEAKLRWIIEEEKACGVKPSVSQNEVDEVSKQLGELKMKKGLASKASSGSE